MVSGFLRLDYHRLDMSAEKIGNSLTAARKGNEHPFGARGLLDNQPHQIIPPGYRTAGLFELVRIFLCSFDKIFMVL
jgi:hypothetical protein